MTKSHPGPAGVPAAPARRRALRAGCPVCASTTPRAAKHPRIWTPGSTDQPRGIPAPIPMPFS
jgi:hypothetical protein